MVVRTEAYEKVGSVHNLTVANTHTYYVLAGAIPVLVHNTGPFCGVDFNDPTASESP